MIMYEEIAKYKILKIIGHTSALLLLILIKHLKYATSLLMIKIWYTP